MSLHWTAARAASFRDAYLDWARLLQRRRDALPPARPDGGAELEPIFVRLTEQTDDARTRLRTLVQDPATPLFMDPHELQALTDRIGGTGPEAGLPDEYALYRRMGTPDSDHADLFTVLDTGMPVTMGNAALAASAGVPRASSHPEGAPIMALIDDGIGFLNARFCRTAAEGALSSRFHAIWLQTLERGNPDSAEVTSGRVLDGARIDAMLAEGFEPGAYARLNAQLFGARSRRETEFATTHGTHVLDLAAGAEPDDANDPVRDWPLLGVQLPPEAIDDTSGTWFANYMLQGLRWLLRQARRIDPKAPVIVNLSLGITAGPKDGSRFAEYQMAREARLWEEVTGQPVRLVWAFGNNYRSNQLARFELTDSDPRAQSWRVQPDDETASFVELHCRDADSSAVELCLTTPCGTSSGYEPLAPGELRSLEKEGSAVARIYHVPARDYGTGTVCQAHYVIALAPTRAQKTGEPEARAGGWQVGLRRSGPAQVTVLAQVQRDDATRGGRVRGRQSYFDGPHVHDWDTEEMAYTAPRADDPVTPVGSHSAQVTARTRQVFSCGAARRSARADTPGASDYRPSGYSAQGADWSVPGPTGATMADAGTFASGVLGCGTATGTTRRLTGTSAAAGRMSRALGQSATRIAANAGNPATVPRDDFDETIIRVLEIALDDRSRLGDVLVHPDSASHRDG